jgi:hypothetical protein
VVGSISAFIMAVGAITWMHHMFAAAPFIFGAGTSAYQVHTSLCMGAVNVKTLISWIGWMP